MSERWQKLRAWVGTALAQSVVWIGVAIAVLAVIGSIGVVIAYLVITPRHFDLAEIEAKNRIPGVTFYDAKGVLLASRGAYHGDVITLKDLPPYLPKAFIAIEDRRFYQHWGIDPRGILRSIWVNLRTGHTVQGGSTITQQLARNLFLSNDKKISRKLNEVLYAVWLERHLTKPQILELYLNSIYFGAGTFGVDAASRFYFNKPAKEVTLTESAMLAGLPKSPSRLSPTASAKSLESAQSRAGFVLRSMAEERFITAQELQDALAQKVTPFPRSLGVQYYLDYVFETLSTLLPEGTVDPKADLVVYTTLDAKLQQVAEDTIATYFCNPKDQSDPNAKGCKENKAGEAALRHISDAQAALVSIDPNGALKAMVGGKSYFDTQFNRATTAQRQPGSSFKPFVYLTALEHGYTPDSIVDDAPITISTPQGDWSPTNYEAGGYEGPVTLRVALAKSLNTVSVRLTEAVGPQTVADTAHRLGIASPLPPEHAIALGADEVNLLEMTGAFLPFERNGLKVPVHTIDKVTTKAGQVVFEYKAPEPVRVIDANVATQMTNLMFGVMYSGTGARARLADRPAAGKTGTSSEWRDAWFMGYTGNFITGVWIGKDDSTPMDHVTGGSLPAAIWKDYMTKAHEGLAAVQMPGAYPSRGAAANNDLQSFYQDLAAELGDLGGVAAPAPTEQPAAPPPKKRRWPW